MKSFKMVAAAIGAVATIFAGGVSAQSGGVLLPITITNASGNVADMGLAADGNPNTAWNSGGPPTQWIDIDLGSERMASKIRILPSQVPKGEVKHKIWGRNSSGQIFYITETPYAYSGEDNKWIEFYNDREWTARWLIIQTIKSPSWVSWRELQVYDGGAIEEKCDYNVNRRGWALWATSEFGCGGSGKYKYYYRDVRNLPSGAGVESCVSIEGVPGLIYKGFYQDHGKCPGFLQTGYYYYQQE